MCEAEMDKQAAVRCLTSPACQRLSRHTRISNALSGALASADGGGSCWMRRSGAWKRSSFLRFGSRSRG